MGGSDDAAAAAALLLLFQPQVRVSDGATVGCEALLRARLPDGDLLPATAVLARAEARDRARTTGEWTITEACRQAARWRTSGSPLRVSVNVSALQVQEPGFAQAVEVALSANGLPPALLTLEVTETAPLPGCIPAVRENLGRLRSAGVGLTLDNFGTGYATLSTLRLLPFTGAKIAPSYVRDIAKDASTRHVVAGLVGLFRSLELDVIATGVETAAQRDALVGLGCEVQQGFLHAPPQPEDQFLGRTST
jgi:EAL domain-containing protein (putative c-di-GMP-specific phosphodiesterase class I)